MIPPPPRSTLFPYTTLFRSNVLDLSSPQSANELATRVWRADHTGENSCTLPRDARLGISEIGTIYAKWHLAATRSEEHTSELQSHSDLVCRLLLEKKKKKNN